MEIKVLYATVTGNCEDIANNAKQELDKAGFNADVENIANIGINHLEGYKNVLLITSTWGDGEPPMDVQDFYDDFRDTSINLSGVKYAVFGLGESIYEKFCQAAIDFDEYFAKNGATKLLDVVKADGEADSYFAEWMPKVISAFK